MRKAIERGNMSAYYRGLGEIKDMKDFTFLEVGGDGKFQVGKEGVKAIFTPLDKKVEFIAFEEKTLCYVKSALGYPAIYPLEEIEYEAPTKAVLMDLDGTSVHSESFWMWIIERTMATLMQRPDFKLEKEDEPHVSGHSVSEHLQYCISKYCPTKSVEEARRYYFKITDYEMDEILKGRGKEGAFTPAPGLKEFLLELKSNGIPIGLVTSGLYQKAMPEIISAFKTLDMGNPLEFYDAIITAGTAIVKGQTGTIGELAPKPHPWLYAETARVGLGIDVKDRNSIIGLEDSSAGIVSIRLANMIPVGIGGGNIRQSGTSALCSREYNTICDALPFILKDE